MQSWGHASRFERRTTALHPTRSGVLGIIAAALGIDKHAPDETTQLARFDALRVTTVKLDKRDGRGRELLPSSGWRITTPSPASAAPAAKWTRTPPCRPIATTSSTPASAC